MELNSYQHLDTSTLEEILKIQRKNLVILEERRAKFGSAHVPLHMINEVEDTRNQIYILLEELSKRQSSQGTAQSQTDPITLLERWQSIVDRQIASSWRGVIPEIREFVQDFCAIFDFTPISDTYCNYHNRFIVCWIKALTFHLNLPPVFPLILLLEERPSEQTVQKLSRVSEIEDKPVDFALLLAIGPQRLAQRMVADLIRPALKTDIIVLGRRFLESIAFVPNPRSALLQEILREIDLTRISPFVAGGANRNSSMFFGREGELKNIAEHVKHSSVAITCGRRIGKTTLLRHLHQVVLPQRNHTSFFLDCQTIHDYHDFRSAMISAWKQPDIPFDPEQPNSFAQVADALTGADGAPPIFLLDEIDTLLQYDARHGHRLFKQLRALSLGGRAYMVVTGERSVQAHLHNADSPLFNFFGYTLKLSFLNQPSINKLVNDPIADMQIQLSEPLSMVDTIFQATSGHPYLVQRLCQGLIQGISKRSERIIDPADIDDVLNDHSYQQDYFETVWGQAPPLARIITMLVPERGATLNEIRHRLKDRSISPPLRDIQTALDILDLYSVMENKGGRYAFIAMAFPAMLQRAYGEDMETNIELRCEEYLWNQASSTTAP